MSLLAGAVHVNLTADALGFTQGVNSAEKSLASLDKGTQSTEGGLGKLGNIAQIAIGNVLAGAFTSATSAAKNFFDAQMSGAKDFETTRVAFDGIIGDTQKAGQVMDQVVKAAAKTPFEIPELANAAKMLAGFGVAADDVLPSVMMVGDVAAGLNVPIGDMSYLVGTIKSQGKAMTADLNQFANRGVPIWQALGKVTGKTNEQLHDMASSGEISYELIEKSFKGMTTQGGLFNGMMDRISGTSKGLDSTLSDAFGSIGRRILGMTDTGQAVTGGLFEKIKKGTSDMIVFMSQPVVVGFADQLGKGIGYIFDGLSQVKVTIGYVFDNFKVLFDFISGVDIGNETFFGLDSNILFKIFISIFEIKDVLMSLGSEAITFIIEKLGEFANFYSSILGPAILNFYTQVWLVLSKGLTDFATLVMPYIISTIKYFADSWTTILLPGIMLFWIALQPLLHNIMDIIVMITPFVMPFLVVLVDYFVNYFAPLIGSAVQLVAVIIGVVVLVIIAVLTQLTGCIKAVVSTALAFWYYFGDGIRSILIGITLFLNGFIDIIVGIFTGNGDRVKQGFLGMFTGIGTAIQGIFQIIGGALRAAMNSLVVDPINRMLGTLPSQIAGIPVPKPGRVPSFSAGVEDFGGGMAYVHAGELLTNLPRGTNVHTKAETSEMLSGGQQDINITFSEPFIATEESLDKLAMMLTRSLRKAKI
jgi:tape measure domain-containing protein